jgi:hypothetical protein
MLAARQRKGVLEARVVEALARQHQARRAGPPHQPALALALARLARDRQPGPVQPLVVGLVGGAARQPRPQRGWRDALACVQVRVRVRVLVLVLVRQCVRAGWLHCGRG